MSLQGIRKVLLALGLLTLFLAGVWIVVANSAHVAPVNLLLVEIPAVSAGVLVLGSFAAGALCGLVVALAAFRVVPMHFQLRRSRKELEALRQLQSRPQTPP